MKIVFRVDASLSIGSGHVMRCLTFADELNRRGMQVLFMCRLLPGNLIGYIEKKGYLVVPLNLQRNEYFSCQDDAYQCMIELENMGEIDWIIVDNYDLDESWEFVLHNFGAKIFVIDDLANRTHICEILLDQNYYKNSKTRYSNLVPGGCQMLLGPSFTLLREEFAKERTAYRARNGCIERILVFFGGSDINNVTLKTLKALQAVNCSDLTVDVIIGSQNPHRLDLEIFTSSLERVTTHFQVGNMAEFIATSDLYVGAAGTTTWERCCLGLPSLVITVAPNQVQASKDLDHLGVLTYMGCSTKVSIEQITTVVEECIASPERMRKQAETSFALVDGYGTLRCADAIINFF